MEKEPVTRVRRLAPPVEASPASPLETIDPAVLAEVRGSVFAFNSHDIPKGEEKRASGAYAITIPPENPDDETATAEERPEN